MQYCTSVPLLLSLVKDSLVAFLRCHQVLSKRDIPAVREVAAFLSWVGESWGAGLWSLKDINVGLGGLSADASLVPVFTVSSPSIRRPSSPLDMSWRSGASWPIVTFSCLVASYLTHMSSAAIEDEGVVRLTERSLARAREISFLSGWVEARS